MQPTKQRPVSVAQLTPGKFYRIGKGPTVYRYSGKDWIGRYGFTSVVSPSAMRVTYFDKTELTQIFEF